MLQLCHHLRHFNGNIIYKTEYMTNIARKIVQNILNDPMMKVERATEKPYRTDQSALRSTLIPYGPIRSTSSLNIDIFKTA